MDRDSVSEGADADTKETGDAVAVDEAVAGYGKKKILAGLSLRVRINKKYYFLQLILTNSKTLKLITF